MICFYKTAVYRPRHFVFHGFVLSSFLALCNVFLDIYAHRIEKHTKACHVFEELGCPKSHEDVILNLYTYA